VDAIAQGGEPAGIDPGAAAHVEDGAGRRREVAEDDLLGARELDDAMATEEALGLATLVGPRLPGEGSGLTMQHLEEHKTQGCKCHNVRPDPVLRGLTVSGMVSP
ncbi:MAG TPA: hypothetical protein VNS56_08430, partial [Methylomirabilota bacterium]|nr:hypothetical protein [Methylomirabilota bacterium]